MKKNVIYWIGVIPEDNWNTKRYKYGDYSWMDYSKKTWEYWCDRNNVRFVHYDGVSKPFDLKRLKLHHQRWFDLEEFVGDFDSCMLVDASIMVKWDAPNYFDLETDGICVLRADENWKWVWESIQGYKDLFPHVDFIPNDYFSSGFTRIQQHHLFDIQDYKQFFFEHQHKILEIEDVTVQRGRDQPLINYIMQRNGVARHYWPITMGVNHMYRRQILQGNHQQVDQTPFYIKYFNAWIFSGFPDRGDTRSKLMGQTWDIVKHHYQ